MENSIELKVAVLVEKGLDMEDICSITKLNSLEVTRIKRSLENNKVSGLVPVSTESIAKAELDLHKDTTKHIITKESLSQLSASDLAEKLDVKLHQTAMMIDSVSSHLAFSCETPKELHLLADIACKLKLAFLPKVTSQINIQTNVNDQTVGKYKKFLSDVPEKG